MKRIAWDEQEPGRFEVDLVHHCGDSASGEYACTLQMIDIATGWSEPIRRTSKAYLHPGYAPTHMHCRLREGCGNLRLSNPGHP
jgi:hypothetical protein